MLWAQGVGQRSLDFQWQKGSQFCAHLNKCFHAGGGRAQNELAETGRLGQGVGGDEHATPGMTEEIVYGDAQAANQIIQLGEEKIDGEEAWVILVRRKVGGAAAANLIIHHDGYGVVGADQRDGEEVIVRDARAAMDADQGNLFAGKVAPYRVGCLCNVVGGGNAEADGS